MTYVPGVRISFRKKNLRSRMSEIGQRRPTACLPGTGAKPIIRLARRHRWKNARRGQSGGLVERNFQEGSHSVYRRANEQSLRGIKWLRVRIESCRVYCSNFLERKKPSSASPLFVYSFETKRIRFFFVQFGEKMEKVNALN